MAIDGGRPAILVVVGPTAVGKSEFALLACERFGGEVVSVDSMQVYRGLDAATSKPSAADRRRAPHHGLDLVDPGDDFSMGDFVRAAEKAIAEIGARRRLPVLVGGTGLYLRALLRGMADAPRRAPALRERLRARAALRGTPWLHRMLTRLDPETASRLPRRDRQRLVRALEVRFLMGRPLSTLIRERPFGESRYDAVRIGLTMERSRLHARIDARVGAFFRAGLVEEVRRHLAAGRDPGANAFRALGYKEVLAHLRGECTLEEAVALTCRNTRRYAKRQGTWFRAEPGVTWFTIDPDRPDPYAEAMRHAARALAGPESAAC
ncbi:MAG TPA: tRNA (adenosine(37)-N6)-dimethylallyltransferase MiaA [Patescibacteria group bacterium]|nr:tRNA (adenosine(37)-N6)-dimethylallyltransferase MiaA [Patescibacteria group bacterium]